MGQNTYPQVSFKRACITSGIDLHVMHWQPLEMLEHVGTYFELRESWKWDNQESWSIIWYAQMHHWWTKGKCKMCYHQLRKCVRI